MNARDAARNHPTFVSRALKGWKEYTNAKCTHLYLAEAAAQSNKRNKKCRDDAIHAGMDTTSYFNGMWRAVRNGLPSDTPYDEIDAVYRYIVSILCSDAHLVCKHLLTDQCDIHIKHFTIR